jgi:glucose 1-dehydrogenase
MTRLAVVTGARGGIGSAVVGTLHVEGWTVFGIDAPDPGETLPTPKASVSSCDHFHAWDLRNWRDVPDVLTELVGDSPVQLLVNNAAVQVVRHLTELSQQELADTFAVNALAPFQAITALVPHLASGQGCVVNIASVHAQATSPGMAAYAASKSALIGLTRAAAIDLAPQGIRVNAVLPGAIDTPMLRHGIESRADDPAAGFERLERSTPLSRVGTPAEVASLVAFLADPHRSGFITGQSYVCDGGALAMLGTE